MAELRRASLSSFKEISIVTDHSDKKDLDYKYLLFVNKDGKELRVFPSTSSDLELLEAWAQLAAVSPVSVVAGGKTSGRE